MRQYTAVVQHCSDTHLYVGYIPGFPGAHSQGATLDELGRNLNEGTDRGGSGGADRGRVSTNDSAEKLRINAA